MSMNKTETNIVKIKDAANNAVYIEAVGGNMYLMNVYDKELLKDINTALKKDILKVGIMATITVDKENLKVLKMELGVKTNGYH